MSKIFLQHPKVCYTYSRIRQSERTSQRMSVENCYMSEHSRTRVVTHTHTHRNTQVSKQ